MRIFTAEKLSPPFVHRIHEPGDQSIPGDDIRFPSAGSGVFQSKITTPQPTHIDEKIKANLLLQQTVRELEEKARLHKSKEEQIQRIDDRLIDKNRIREFANLVEGLQKLSNEIDEVIQRHRTYVTLRNPFQDVEGALERLHQIDLKARFILSFKQPIPNQVPELSSEERAYIQSRDNLKESVTKLKDLTEKYLGRCVIYNENFLMSRMEIKPNIECLIEDNSICRGETLSHMFEEHLSAINQLQCEKLNLDPRIKDNIKSFIFQVEQIYKASETLGENTKDSIKEETRAFGAGDGKSRKGIHTYELRHRFDKVNGKSGFWIDLERARERIETLKKIHLDLDKQR